ncbi:MAG TPA: YfhO family protein, partial [Vicinamibacteria bacterium]|nr:YfhO family protein [Vicinamibacteria bacterium]
FDLSLCVLGGLCLSALWRQRRSPRGARLRALFLITCLVSAAALSIAAASLGPLPQTLAGAVGTLALALILYFANAGGHGLRARAWLLPLTAAFLLQPHGRQAWEGAPDARALYEGSGTRRALARATSSRAAEPVLTLAGVWPGLDGDDLAYGNLAGLAGRRTANGYDPMVPLRTRAALGSMSVGGVLPAGFPHGDPGRLELLGVRWVQVPVSALRGGAGRGAAEPAVHVPLSGPRFFPFPMTAARSVRIVSSLVDAAAVPQGHVVARVYVRLASGRGEFAFPLRAGLETAEWAWDRADVRAAVAHRRPPPAESWPVQEEGFSGHHYLAELPLPGSYYVDGVRLEPAAESYWLQLMRLALVEAPPARPLPLSGAALYVSDAHRLREAAAMPTVRLFEATRTMGPARVARALHVKAGDRAVLEAMALPERSGVDPVREALATEADVRGQELPAQGRASRAEVVHRTANRLDLRAEGPGVLVLAESWDRGWRARLDGRPARLLRVNHAQLGMVLPAGTHRVQLRYRPRGFALALALSAAGALALGALLLGRRN